MDVGQDFARELPHADQQPGDHEEGCHGGNEQEQGDRHEQG